MNQGTSLAPLTGVLRHWPRLLTSSVAALLATLVAAGLLGKLAFLVHKPQWIHAADAAVIALALGLALRFTRRQPAWSPSPRVFRALLLAGCLLRLLVLLHDVVDRPEPYSDFLVHEQLGQRIAFEHAYYEPRAGGVLLRAYRPFGLPLLLAPFDLALGPRWGPLALYHALSLGVLLLWHHILRHQRNAYAALALAYLALTPNALAVASFANTQLPFLFFLTLTLLVLQRATPSRLQAATLGALMATLLALRLYAPIVPAAIVHALDSRGWRRATRRWLVLALAAAAVVYAPWVLRNYEVFGRFLPGFTAWGRYQTLAVDDITKAGLYNEGHPPGFLASHPVIDELQWKHDLDAAADAWILAHPLRHLQSLPFRAVHFMDNQTWATDVVFAHSALAQWPRLHFALGRIDLAAFWLVVAVAALAWLRRPPSDALSRLLLLQYLLAALPLVIFLECWSRYHYPFFLLPLLALALRADPRAT